jgi:hypothetical protein
MWQKLPKKTGLVDQGMIEKPGEFSNLVLEWDSGVIGFALYCKPNRNYKIQRSVPQRTLGLVKVKHHLRLLSKGADQVLSPIDIEISKTVAHSRRSR